MPSNAIIYFTNNNQTAIPICKINGDYNHNVYFNLKSFLFYKTPLTKVIPFSSQDFLFFDYFEALIPFGNLTNNNTKDIDDYCYIFNWQNNTFVVAFLPPDANAIEISSGFIIEYDLLKDYIFAPENSSGSNAPYNKILIYSEKQYLIHDVFSISFTANFIEKGKNFSFIKEKWYPIETDNTNTDNLPDKLSFPTPQGYYINSFVLFDQNGYPTSYSNVINSIYNDRLATKSGSSLFEGIIYNYINFTKTYAWQYHIKYKYGDVVEYRGKLYMSLSDNNIYNNPACGISWKELLFYI